LESYGWLSIVPPIAAIGLAIKTRQVYLALGLFVWLGWTIMCSGNPLLGSARSLDAYVVAVTEIDNARVLMFSVLIGSMIKLTQASGGMEGFVGSVERLGLARSRRTVGLLTAAISMAVFLESNFGLLVSGSVARPLYDRFRISREKLAYVIDATCSPKCILIGCLLPLNAWGAYVAALLVVQEVGNPSRLLMSTIPFNFYSLLALGLAVAVILTEWNPGPMREAERRVLEDGKLLRDGARPMVSEEVSGSVAREGVPLRAANMIVPIGTMVAVVPISLWMTGDGNLSAGNGSLAVLWGVIAGLLVAVVGYRLQGVLTIEESIQEIIKGIQGLVPLVIVLSLAFTIGATTRALGTGVFVAQAAQAALPLGMIPALVFLLACFIAFSTGTSWGTFAIMVPIVIPMIELLGLHPALTLAAALGGGIFGDHCSPISDTTIVASMASATDHIDHVRTQLPYAAVAATAATALYVIFGFAI